MRTVLRRALCASWLIALSGLSYGVEEREAIHRIDELVREGLRAGGLQPNPPSSDEVFVRRIHLDLIGRIPTRAETTEFLNSQDPEKRSTLVKALIGSDGYVSHSFNWWADLLRLRTAISGNGQSTPAGLAYEKWIKAAIRENRPYDEWVRELLTATGSSWENPAIGYYLRDFNMPLDSLAITTQVFLGTQIVCAQCHNHPFDNWTQLDYYRFAAYTHGMSGRNEPPHLQEALALLEPAARPRRPGAGRIKGRPGPGGEPAERQALRRAAVEIFFPLRFNRVEASDRPLRLPRDYAYEDARPLSVAKPQTLFGEEAPVHEGEPPIHAFAAWLSSPENPRFAKVIANRLWKRAFGLGLVEPVDDFRENSAASNPALLDYLEHLVVDLGFDLQAFQRILYQTEAYQREASREEVQPGVPYLFPGPLLRRMSAEQIWDSLVAMSVDDPDRPNRARDLLSEQKLAEVQLVAEAVSDMSPQELLENLRKVAKMQGELAERITAAQARVAEARAAGDAEQIRQAVSDARAVRRELALLVEEQVYREGLKRKVASPSQGVAERVALGAGLEPESDGALGTEDLMTQLAEVMGLAERDFDLAWEDWIGEDSRGLVEPLISALFADRSAAIQAEEAERRSREREEWGVHTRQERMAYQQYVRKVRGRMRRASEMVQPAPAGHFLREFGQSDRELVENANDEAAVTQALALLNGPVLSAVTNRYSVLMRDLRGQGGGRRGERLNIIYLTVLSRYPTEEERAIFRDAWAADSGSGNVPGIVWTLLNTRQFLFIQ